MKLHIVSDLHLEFGAVEIPAVAADLSILAGDVHVGGKGLPWIESHFKNQPVVYILGNHEFYHHSLPELTVALKRETIGSNINLLENAALELQGYTFLGCTLWSSFRVGPDPDAAMQAAEGMMNDYRIIRNSTENRILRAADTARLHRESVAWLATELRRHDPAKTIVITHHAPSLRGEEIYHKNSPLSPAFASDLDALIDSSGIPLWIYGHTHHNADFRIGATRVLTNQRGYPSQECRGFDPALVVEV